MYKKIWYRKGALAAIPWSTSLLGMVGLEGFVGDMLGGRTDHAIDGKTTACSRGHKAYLNPIIQ